MGRLGFTAVEDASGLHFVCYENGSVTAVLSGLLGCPDGAVGRAFERGERPRECREIAVYKLAAVALAAAAERGLASIVGVREEDGTVRTFPERMSAVCRRAFGLPAADMVLS
ncbi:MAG: hypothetical protein HDQ87_06290 [Clostridia bacterium]|nr:hypothetical protein [Clostridia bacterium]